MSGDKLNKDIKKLEDALEASNKTITIGSSLKLKDEGELAEKYLTEKAKKAIGNSLRDLRTQDKDGNFFQCIFLGASVKSENIEKAVKAVSKVANELADQGLIYGSLCNLSSLDLVKVPGRSKTSIVILYLHVPEDEAVVNKIYKDYARFVFSAEEEPKPLEDLSLELSEGEFFATIRVSRTISMMTNAEEIRDKEIETLMSVLPEGTELRSVVECGIFDMSVPYEVKFYNPKLKSVNRISLEHCRACEVVDGKLEQFNVVTGVNYYDSEGNRIFRKTEGVTQ